MGHKHISTSVNALIIGILLSFIFITPGKAQFVDLGQDPSSVRWRQIKTNNFQITPISSRKTPSTWPTFTRNSTPTPTRWEQKPKRCR